MTKRRKRTASRNALLGPALREARDYPSSWGGVRRAPVNLTPGKGPAPKKKRTRSSGSDSENDPQLDAIAASLSRGAKFRNLSPQEQAMVRRIAGQMTNPGGGPPIKETLRSGLKLYDQGTKAFYDWTVGLPGRVGHSLLSNPELKLSDVSVGDRLVYHGESGGGVMYGENVIVRKKLPHGTYSKGREILDPQPTEFDPNLGRFIGDWLRVESTDEDGLVFDAPVRWFHRGSSRNPCNCPEHNPRRGGREDWGEFPLRVERFHPRFVSEASLAELSNLWHLSRTPKGNDRHARLVWTAAEFHKLHPEVSETAVYKDLTGMLEFGGRNNPALNQIHTRRGIQETYESASREAGKRAKELRKLGYKAIVAPMGPQVTPVGTVNLTMVDITPGTSGDEYLERVPTVQIERWNPRGWPTIVMGSQEYYDLIQNRETGQYTHQTGPSRQTVAQILKEQKKHGGDVVDIVGADGKHIAYTLVRRPRRSNGSRNTQAGADRMYEVFHGKPPDTEILIEEEIHEHEHLATLGRMVSLVVETRSDKEVTLGWKEGKSDAPWLACDETGTQLYIEGGDQSIPLGDIGMGGKEWIKDSMVIGDLVETTYRTEKDFDKFETIDYYHANGEESGEVPQLLYDPRSKKMYISGGKYRIEHDGIID